MKKTTTKAPIIMPLSDRVLITEINEKEEKTALGIFLPESHNQDKGLKKGKVIAVGEGKFVDGNRVPMTVKKGDIVLFVWGDQVEISNTEYYIVHESEISAIIN